MLNKKEQRIFVVPVRPVSALHSKASASVGEPHQPPHLRQRDFWLRHQGAGLGLTAEAEVRARELAPPASRQRGCRHAIGKRIAEKAKAAGVEKVAFDRAGFCLPRPRQGPADAAREAGLQF